MAARTAATSGCGPVAQPTFQPVTLNVLPSEEIAQRALRHPRQRRQRDVLEPVEHEVLVDLVGDRDQVVLDHEVRDPLQLLAGEHPPGRVVRRVDDDHPRLRRHDEVLERELRRVQRDRHEPRAGHRRGRGIRVVVRIEREHVVARLAQPEDGGGDRLRRAHRHLHLAWPGPARSRRSAAGARRSPRAARARPGSGAYWLRPLRIAACAASSTSAGPSSSGNPCPRLIAPVRSASADISVKIVVPKSGQARGDHARDASDSADRASPRRRRTAPPRRRRRRAPARRPAPPRRPGRGQRRRAARVERARRHHRAVVAVAVVQAEHVAELVGGDPDGQRARVAAEVRAQDDLAVPSPGRPIDVL